MRKVLLSLLNKYNKPVKITGTIVEKVGFLKYVISTKSGKMLVESTVPYKLKDRVVVFDKLIQGYAGIEKQKKSRLV